MTRPLLTFCNLLLSFSFAFTCITKLNAQTANFQWVKTMGGASPDGGYSMTMDASGNIYVTGYFNATADFDPGTGVFNLTSTGVSDIFVSKLDSAGNFVWAKQVGGTGTDDASSIAVDASGNVYITGGFEGAVDFDPGAGTTNLTSSGGSDVFISKLDSAGNFVWAKQMGGTNVENCSSISIDNSGNVYTTGYFQGTADFDPGAGVFNFTSSGGADIFVSKLDASGNFIWAKQMMGVFGDSDYTKSLTLDNSGNVYLTGNFTGTTDFDPGSGVFNLNTIAGSDIFIFKLDAAGNFVWAKQMVGSGTTGDGGYSLTLDAAGNIYTTGFFQGTVDFDPGTGVFNLISAGDYEIFVSKLDASGNFIWAKSMGGTYGERGYSITVDPLSNIYTTGYFNGTADFDPGAGTYNLTSVFASDVFISKLDANGNFVWAKSFGGAGDDSGSLVLVNTTGCVYTAGSFEYTVDFDPGTGTHSISSAGTADVFVHKLGQAAVGIQENEWVRINLFPNPTSGETTIQLHQNLDNVCIKLLNTIGQTVMEKTNFFGDQFTIDFSELAKGVYFLEVKQRENSSVIKLIKH